MFHGQKLNAAAVNAVSSEFENVRVEQKNCHGLTTVRISCSTRCQFQIIIFPSTSPDFLPCGDFISGYFGRKSLCNHEMGEMHTADQADRLPAPYARWAHFQVK